jgi:hypothetical protein
MDRYFARIFPSVKDGVHTVSMVGTRGSPAPAQPTQTTAVEITFHDPKGTFELRGSLYCPEGPGLFPAVVALLECA